MKNNKFNSLWYDVRYLDPELHKNLISVPLKVQKETCKDKIVNKNPRVYLVLFRTIIKNNRSVLIYNYITYHEIFIKSLLIYLKCKPNFASSWARRQRSDFFTIIDSDLFKGVFESPNNEYLDRYFNLQGQIKLYNYFDFFDLLKKFVIVHDSEKISCLIDLALKCEYEQFFTLAFPKAFSYLDHSDLNADTITNLNVLNDCLFVVKDLDKFIKILRSSLQLNVNEGPQAWRGQINTMQQFLSLFDCDYRDSLLHQIAYYLDRYYLDDDRKIEKLKKHYTFENVHIKWGNVKW